MQELFQDPAFWTLSIFLALLILRVPIAISLGFTAIFITWHYDLGIKMMSYNYFAHVAKFQLLAVPFFILAGTIMDKAGLAERIIRLIREVVGTFTGGLAIAAVVVATFWGAVSGSTQATVAAVGTILIPGMVASGYDKAYSTAVVCAASGLAIIIPPSITFILYSSVTGVSVGAIFAAGFFPGFVIAACLMVCVYIICRIRGYKGEPRTDGLRGVLKATRDSFWALLTPIIILGGIYGGIFTPTEAAAVACFYGMFIGVFIYRSMNFADIFDVLKTTASATATTLFIASCAGLYSWVSNAVGLIEKLSGALLSVTGNEAMLLFIIYFILFVAGMFLDAVSIVYVFVPLMIPLMETFGWDPVWFGVMFTVMVAIGTITPPVAANLFMGCRITGLKIEELTPPILPLLGSIFIALAILSAFPNITLFLPRFLGLL